MESAIVITALLLALGVGLLAEAYRRTNPPARAIDARRGAAGLVTRSRVMG